MARLVFSATVTAPEAATILYSNEFATDRSADFTDATYLTHNGSAVFASSGANSLYQFATGAGAMVLGLSQSADRSTALRIAVTPGMVPEIYMLVTGTPTLDITYKYLTSGLSQISATTVQNQSGTRAIIYTMGAAPETAAWLEIFWNKKGTNTTGIFLHAIEVLNIAASGASPVFTGAMPYARAQLMGVGIPYTYDFSGSFTGETGVAYSGSDGIASGTTLTITPTATDGTLNDTSTFDVPANYTIRGTKLTQSSRGAAGLKRFVYDPPTISLDTTNWPIWNVYLEVNRRIVLDAIRHVKDGVWPYTCTIIAKPSWLTEVIPGKGTLEGVAPSTAQSAATVTVRVTDKRGNYVDVTRTVTVIATRSRTATVSPSAGTSGSPTDIKAAVGTLSTNAVHVIELAAGHYTFGNWYGIRRDPQYPVIVRGQGASTVVHTVNLNNACGFIFENFHVEPQTAGATPGNLSARNTASFTGAFNGTLPITAHTFVYGVTCSGFTQNDLTLETTAGWCWRIRNDAGHEGEPILSYAPTTDTRTEWTGADMPTAGTEFGIAYYNGGFGLSVPTILEDCTVTKSVIPLLIGAPSCGVYRMRISYTRTDCFRLYDTADGVVVDDLRTLHPSHYGNMRADEHTDLMQGTPSDVCPKRVLIRDSWLRGAREGIQACQLNTGYASDAATPDADPREGYEDVIFSHSVFLGDLASAMRLVFGNYKIDRCLIASEYSFSGTLVNGTTAIRKGVTSDAEVIGTLYSQINNEDTTVPWTVTDSVDLTTVTATDIFPNLTNGALTHWSPRDAVDASAAANTARLWINPASTWGAANPDIGPSWLRDGL